MSNVYLERKFAAPNYIYLLRLTEIDLTAIVCTTRWESNSIGSNEAKLTIFHRNERFSAWYLGIDEDSLLFHTLYEIVSNFSVSSRARWSVYTFVYSHTPHIAHCAVVYLHFHPLNFPIGSLFAHFLSLRFFFSSSRYSALETQVIFLRRIKKFFSFDVDPSMHFVYRISAVSVLPSHLVLVPQRCCERKTRNVWMGKKEKKKTKNNFSLAFSKR